MADRQGSITSELQITRISISAIAATCLGTAHAKHAKRVRGELVAREDK
jgi:hypothetical protein